MPNIFHPSDHTFQDPSNQCQVSKSTKENKGNIARLGEGIRPVQALEPVP